MTGHAAACGVWCAWTARRGHKTAAGFEPYLAAAAAPTRQNTSLLRSAVGALWPLWRVTETGDRDGLRRSMHGVRGAAAKLQFSNHHASLLGPAGQLLQRCWRTATKPLHAKMWFACNGNTAHSSTLWQALTNLTCGPKVCVTIFVTTRLVRITAIDKLYSNHSVLA